MNRLTNLFTFLYKKIFYIIIFFILISASTVYSSLSNSNKTNIEPPKQDTVAIYKDTNVYAEKASTTNLDIKNTPKKTQSKQGIAQKKVITPDEQSQVIAEKPLVTATDPYCLTSSECAGFKISIDFQEAGACEKVGDPFYPCIYTDSVQQTKQIYYLRIKNDTVEGQLRLKSLNSGTESLYEDLWGTYNPTTGDITFTYGYYLYPNTMVGFTSFTHTGKISNNQFIGSNGVWLNTKGTITYLAIRPDDKIPRKDCLIKGDNSSKSGNSSVYYLTSSISYKNITMPKQWFCSEAEALSAGYSKSLQ